MRLGNLQKIRIKSLQGIRIKIGSLQKIRIKRGRLLSSQLMVLVDYR